MDTQHGAEDFTPDIAVPPGDTLKEILEDRGMSQAELASRMGRSERLVSHVVNGKGAITPGTAYQLEAVLGLPAKFWLGLESDYQLAKARVAEKERLEEDMGNVVKFAYAEMAKLGWVPKTRAKREKVVQLRSFFQVAYLENVPAVADAAYRKAKGQNESPQALAAWLRQGEIQAASIDTQPFDKDTFTDTLRFVRTLTASTGPSVFEDTVNLCAQSGVALVFVPHLKGTYANGVARWVSSNPVIQLSIRGGYDDIFWFSLFHECAHVLKHSKKEIFIHFGEGMTTDEDGREEEADKFAQDFLLPPAEYRQFVAERDFSEQACRTFASSINIAPSIVVGRLLHDGHIKPWNPVLGKLRRRLTWAAPSTN